MKEGKLLLPFILGMAVLLSFSSACSRQKAPVVPEKKPETLEITPTALPPTGAVQSVRLVGTNSLSYKPPRSSASTPEDKKALRESQRVFARQAITMALARNGQQRTAAEMDLVRLETKVREDDSGVRAAYEAWSQARSAYESVCATAIVGHADLTREAAELSARVDKDIAAMENGQVVDTNAIARAMQRIDDMTRSAGDLERKAIYELQQAEVRQAHEALTAAHAAYRKALTANETYWVELEKRATILSEHESLVARQREIYSEN